MTRKLHPFCLLALLLTGCSVMQSQPGEPIPRTSALAVAPLLNLSQAPLAGDQAASALAAILRARGGTRVTLHLPEQESPLLYESDQRQRDGVMLAQETGAAYIVTGTIEEWRYKSGLDGEPAVGVTLEVRAASDERIIWSGTAARSGWGRESLSIAAHKVLDELVGAMPLTDKR